MSRDRARPPEASESRPDPILSDLAVVALALATAGGARLAAAVPLVLAVALVVLVALARRPRLLVPAAAVLASSLGARSWDGLAHPVTGPVAGWATLVSDPEPTERGISVDLRLGGDRYRAQAFGSVAGQLHGRAAGERVEVRGRARRAPPDDLVWLARRHIAARLDIESVGAWSPGAAPARVANLLRRTLDRGAAVMSDDHRSLFAGFVLGDDRLQRPQVIDEFRASGLSHLLAVSGQNVAFVLAIASPGLRRLALGGRLIAAVSLIAFFALVTRFEPSVLRASVMASMAALATTLGREASGMRLLALAVTALLLVDPMLVHSLGFGLSVAASAGILLMGPHITRAMPGPRSIASAVGITLGAQVGVAPLLIPAFGGLPLVALPANLVAAPAAAPLVAWGMSAGVVAGLVRPFSGDGLARALHLPTDMLVGWIAGVARTSARLPLGEVRFGHLAVLVGAVSVPLLCRLPSRPWPVNRLPDGARTLPLVIVAVVGVVATVVRSAVWPPAIHTRPAEGAELWIDSHTHAAVIVLDGDARASPVLEGLRRFGVRRVALLVATVATSRRSFLETVGVVRARYRPASVVAPADAASAAAGALAVRSDTGFHVGELMFVVVAVGSDRLEVRELRPSSPAATDFDDGRSPEARLRPSEASIVRPADRARGPPPADPGSPVRRGR